MNVAKFREVIAYLKYVNDTTQGEWDDEIEKCWKQEFDILSEDIPSTIEFLKNECSAEEYVYISSIFEDLAFETNSQELIDTYKSLGKKYPRECKEYYIDNFIPTLDFIQGEEHIDEETN